MCYGEEQAISYYMLTSGYSGTVDDLRALQLL
jgi:hypothetical protein